MWRWCRAGVAVAALIAVAACGRPPLSLSPELPTSLEPSVTSGPRALDCDYLLSRAEVKDLIGATVESALVSYGDGAGCQYQTARGPGNVIVFTGPVAEQMWSNRPSGSPGPTSPVEINIVDGWPVGHVPGRWLTVTGDAFEVLSLEARIQLVTLLVTRL
jgi:hypothetical protein